MRASILTLVAAGLMLAACGSGGPEPGSADWCKATPEAEQANDPSSMMKCLDAAAKSATP